MLNKRIRISACMMVKNEEKNLERCLKSVKPIVDEIILVDTGSTDRTMEIARRYGAKVYEHPWENDFSLHRNQSISYASGDFIFIVDADEEIVLRGPVSKLKEFLKSLPDKYNAVIITARDIQKGTVAMEFQTARIFRKGKVRYEGIVHNRPVLPGNAGIFTDIMEVLHYGYDLTPEQKQAKFERTSGLLFARLEKNPGDFDCYFYLSQIYADSGKLKEAAEFGEKYLEGWGGGNGSGYDAIYYTLAKCSMELGQFDKAGKWLREGLVRIPDDIDLNFGLVELGLNVRDMNMVFQGANNYFKVYDAYRKNPMMKGKRFTYTAKPRSLAWVRGALAVTHFEAGMGHLKSLGEGLGVEDAGFKNNILETVQKCLGRLEIPIRMDLGPEKQENGKAAVNQ